MNSIRHIAQAAFFSCLTHCGSNLTGSRDNQGESCSVDSANGIFTLHINKSTHMAWTRSLADNRVRQTSNEPINGQPAGQCSVSDNGIAAFDVYRNGLRYIQVQYPDGHQKEIVGTFHPSLDAMGHRLSYVTEGRLSDRRVRVMGLQGEEIVDEVLGTDAVMSANGDVIAYSFISAAGEGIVIRQILLGINRVVIDRQEGVNLTAPMGLSHNGARLLYFSPSSTGPQAYVYDRALDRSELVSLGRNGQSVSDAELSYSGAVISGNGTCVGWSSSSSRFDGETRGIERVFARHLVYGRTLMLPSVGEGDQRIYGIQYNCNSALRGPKEDSSTTPDWVTLTPLGD